MNRHALISAMMCAGIISCVSPVSSNINYDATENNISDGIELHHLSMKAINGHKLFGHKTSNLPGFQIPMKVTGQPDSVLTTPEDVLNYFNSLSVKHPLNRLWLTVADESMYSLGERQSRYALIKLFNRKSIPIYIFDLNTSPMKCVQARYSPPSA